MTNQDCLEYYYLGEGVNIRKWLDKNTDSIRVIEVITSELIG